MEPIENQEQVDYRKLLLKYMFSVWENESVTYVPHDLPHLSETENNPQASEIDYTHEELAALRQISDELGPFIDRKWNRMGMPGQPLAS